MRPSLNGLIGAIFAAVFATPAMADKIKAHFCVSDKKSFLMYSLDFGSVWAIDNIEVQAQSRFPDDVFTDNSTITMLVFGERAGKIEGILQGTLISNGLCENISADFSQALNTIDAIPSPVLSAQTSEALIKPAAERFHADIREILFKYKHDIPDSAVVEINTLVYSLRNRLTKPLQ